MSEYASVIIQLMKDVEDKEMTLEREKEHLESCRFNLVRCEHTIQRLTTEILETNKAINKLKYN